MASKHTPTRPRARRPARPKAPLDLALQGGGSHGAFTWGVLDRLLEDEALPIAGISGTSAGALNAAVLATGWAEGGRAGARAALAAFWADVGCSHTPWGGCFGAVTGGPAVPAIAAMPGLAAYNLDRHPLYHWGQQWLRWFSPYQFDPLGENPLRAVLQRHVRPEALRDGPIELFVTATSVRTGQPRVFDARDLSLDALLASACLPHLFKAVQIDGQAYWDGGYAGNPALWPLIYGTTALDLLLVKINPLVREDTPDTAAEIADRVGEIAFNAVLAAEFRAIGFVGRLIQEGRLGAGRYKQLRLHMVADEGLSALNPSSKLNTAPAFLQQLHARGRAAAEAWLVAHRNDVGVRSSLDLQRTFLEPR